MNQDYPTTPFGRRTMSLGMVAGHVAAKNCPDEPAHKWKLFRTITECREAIGVSDRTLAVLNALLSCIPETALMPGRGMIVHPSNATLTLRTHGMAELTLRRHLLALVQAGLIVRRDSPNGKRYARRGQGGDVQTAYGFDLSPILARAREFERLATQTRQTRAEAIMAREKITILRRDIAKMIDAGTDAEIDADWDSYRAAFLNLCRRLPRVVSMDIVAPLADDLLRLAVAIGKHLEDAAKTQIMDGNDNQNDAHIQNSNADSSTDLEPDLRESQGRKSEPTIDKVVPFQMPLGMILKACPDFTMYNRHGISNWRDFATTANLVRSSLGISPSAWEDAKNAMGEISASITVAAMLQRADAIGSAGGYLRNLTAKARDGKFSTGPMIMALLKTGLKRN